MIKLSHHFLKLWSHTAILWNVNQISWNENVSVCLFVWLFHSTAFKYFPCVYFSMEIAWSLWVVMGGCQKCRRTSALFSTEALVCWDIERLLSVILIHLFVITRCPYTSPFCQHNYSQSCEHCPDQPRDPLPCQLQFQKPFHSSSNIWTLFSAPRTREFDSKSRANGSYFLIWLCHLEGQKLVKLLRQCLEE